MKRQVEFDPRLKHPFTCMVVSPTQCGKTRFVLELIHRPSSIYPPPERIVWCFGCYQDWFRTVDGVEFVECVPDMSILDGGKKRTLLIIDDLKSETDTRVTKIFTKGSHHLNCNVVYISQNFFNKDMENTNICFDIHYLVLFKNPRDSAQIVHLGRQIFADVIKYFKESFADATSLPYGYLLIDLRTMTPRTCDCAQTSFLTAGWSYMSREFEPWNNLLKILMKTPKIRRHLVQLSIFQFILTFIVLHFLQLFR